MRNIRVADPRDRVPSTRAPRDRVPSAPAPRDRVRDLLATIPIVLLVPALVVAFGSVAANGRGNADPNPNAATHST